MAEIEKVYEDEVIKVENLIEDIENRPNDKVERILVTRNIGGEEITDIYDVYFNTGNYEIGISNNYKIGQPIWESMPIGLINGGLIKYKNVNLRYNIIPEDWHKEWQIEKVYFTMPQDDAKLSDVFETTPYGLIKKNRTGVGATTLELKCPRNSIIVVPTKALASEKTKSTWDEELQKNKACYVGGDVNGLKKTSIEEYLNDSAIEHKKFLVVANSLPRLVRKLGEDCFKNYFLMIDEIDSYQYDNSYRPELEDVMDYYFQFPQKLRCMVSATISKFSNPQINAEPVIEVQFNEPAPRHIHLLHTENIIETAKKQIESILQEHPNDKILVAYNTVKGIKTVIETFEDALKEKCAILCSEKSKATAQEYYSELTDNMLPKQVNFMTCTYFVGIDINEPFHLVSIANIQKAYTLLSKDKLQQIAGRCRIPNGILSETVIYNSNPAQDIDMETVKGQLVDAAKLLSDYANLIPTIKRMFPRIINNANDIDERAKELIIENSCQNYCGIKTAPLVRVDKKGHFKPSYFNIDNALIQLNLRKTLYNSAQTLLDKLREQGHHVYGKEAETNCAENYQDIMQRVEDKKQQSIAEEREKIIQELRECPPIVAMHPLRRIDNIEGRESLANSQKISCNSERNAKFLDRFIELQKYVPFELLIEKLQKYDNIKYDDFYNAVVFWSLNERHPLKILIKENFPINAILTGDEMTERFNSIWTNWFPYTPLTNKLAFPKIRIFCKLQRTSQRVKSNSHPIPVYKIVSYDSFDLNCNPLKERPDTTSYRDFRF